MNSTGTLRSGLPGEQRIRSGFTLLELLIVLGVCLVLLVLMLPMFQRMREQARMTQCKNNLKAIGLAMHHYHDKFNYFPMGCTGSAGNAEEGTADDWGYSWWVPILPHLDQAALFNQWNFSVPSSGYDGQRSLLTKVKIPMARCPSTTLTNFKWTPDGLAVSTYAGMAGAVECQGDFDNLYQTGVCLPATELNHSRYTANGIHATNGMFGLASETAKFVSRDKNGMYLYQFYGSKFISLPEFAGQSYSRAMTHMGILNCLDGTSNIIFVVEQSGLCRNLQDSTPTIAGSSWPQGMWCGTLNQDRYFNITTFRHPLGYDLSEGGDASTNCSTTGVCANLGNNTPIQSAHKDGALVLLVDGTVRFLNTKINYATLHDLATRNSGRVVNGY